MFAGSDKIVAIRMRYLVKIRARLRTKADNK